jgi:hypothetical protein
MTDFYNIDFELGWLWMSFHNEQCRLLPFIDKTKSNEYNRTYLRAFFSMIEGITYRTRQILLERQKDNKINLSPEQIIALSEISIELENNGKIKKRQRFYEFRSIMLFTYKTYCECLNKTDIYNRFLSDIRYNDFKESIKIRNFITHPKSGKDVFVNGIDIQTIMSAGDWYHEFSIEIFIGDLLKQQ